jgi:bifunctional non-homologous end joining protein LigD
MAVKRGDRVRLWSRNGRDWSTEFTGIAEALRALPDCTIDGEACAYGADGLPDFWEIRAGGAACVLFAFDLLFLNTTSLFRLQLRSRVGADGS